MTTIPALELLAPDALARGLLSGDERLAGLVTHAPGDPASLLAAGRAAAARDIDRAALVDALSAGLHALAAPEPAHAAAGRLREPGAVVVVAGQQPGLLGGSVLVLVKALAAAALARRLESEGVPAVPVFWHASEDHDHAEADHVGWPRRGEVERLQVELPEDGRMLSRVPVPAAAVELTQHILEEVAAGPGRDVLGDVLPPRGGESFATWTGRLLARVLGAQGIVVVEPARLRAAGEAVVRHEIDRPGQLRAALVAAEERVERAGYALPLALRRDALWFAVDEAGCRRPPGEVPDLAREGEWFSWNVVGRVLAQDLALPVAAQVCGPSELGYVGLLREAHAVLGVPQPLAVPRPGLTVVAPAARRACEALGVSPADVVRQGASALPPAPVAAAGRLDSLERAIAALPPGRSPAAQRRRAALVREAGLFAAALAREAAEDDVTRDRRCATVLAALRPRDRLQERVLSFLPWYAAGGDAVVARLGTLLGGGEPVHHVLRTEDL